MYILPALVVKGDIIFKIRNHSCSRTFIGWRAHQARVLSSRASRAEKLELRATSRHGLTTTTQPTTSSHAPTTIPRYYN